MRVERDLRELQNMCDMKAEQGHCREGGDQWEGEKEIGKGDPSRNQERISKNSEL